MNFLRRLDDFHAIANREEKDQEGQDTKGQRGEARSWRRRVRSQVATEGKDRLQQGAKPIRTVNCFVQNCFVTSANKLSRN